MNDLNQYSGVPGRSGDSRHPEDDRARIQDYRDRWGRLKNQRATWDPLWIEVGDYLLPRRGFFSDRGDKPNDGRSRRHKIFESRPTKALRNLASLMQSGLTSPARPWLRIGLSDPKASDWGPSRIWLDQVETMLYQAFARSNFYGSIHTTYKELAGFGTGCLYEEEDADGYVRFRSLTVGEYAAALDASGRVDTMYRECPLTARQIVQKWGRERASRAVLRALESDPYSSFTILHVVQPRREYDDRKKGPGDKPWESVYLEADGDGRFLWEGGYEEFPFMVPRWDTTTAEDVYGRSPAMDLLPDVKTLMEVSKAIIKGVHMEIEPPMLVPPGYKDRLDLLPGALNYDELSGGEGIRPLYQIRPSLEAAQAYKQDLLAAIREGFFNDLFVFLLNRPNVTATEIAERHEEKLLLLGPVIERQQAELLDPLIHRSYGLLGRARLIPAPPPGLERMALKVEYVSLLAQAQKLVGTQSIQSILQFAGAAAQVDPRAIDKINVDAAVDLYADLVGVPARVIRPVDEVNKLRRERQRAQAEAAAQEKQAAAVQTAKGLSDIGVGQEDSSPLMTGGSEQGA